MHLLYIALMIFWKRTQQIKNVTEKEIIPSDLRVSCYMCCLETFSYSGQNLSHLNDVASLPQRLREGECPRAGRPRLKLTKCYGGSWADPRKAQEHTPTLLPCLHWPSAAEQPKHCPNGCQGGVGGKMAAGGQDGSWGARWWLRGSC